MTDNEVLERLKSNKAIELWHIPTKSMMYIVGIVIGEGGVHGYLLDRKSCFHSTRYFLIEEPKPNTVMERVLEILTHELAVSRQPNNYRNGHTAGLMLAVKVVKDLINKEKSK